LADHSEILHMLHENRLYGTGLGWIDLHLLAAAVGTQRFHRLA
jgi:hypothetical protein